MTNTVIKSYLGFGLAANRPSSPSVDANSIAFYFATDTGVLTVWNGSSWGSVGGGYNPGTTPTIVQSGSENTGAQGITLANPPANGNLLIAMNFNSSVSTPGSGWTSVLQNSSGTDYGTIYKKTAGGSESATQNPLSSAPGTGCTVMWELSGVSSILAASSEAEQSSATFATSVPLGPLDQKLMFLGAIGLVSTTGNLVSPYGYGVTIDQNIHTGATRQIVGGHATIDKFPIAQIAAAFSAASSYKPLGLLLTA